MVLPALFPASPTWESSPWYIFYPNLPIEFNSPACTGQKWAWGKCFLKETRREKKFPFIRWCWIKLVCFLIFSQHTEYPWKLNICPENFLRTLKSVWTLNGYYFFVSVKPVLSHWTHDDDTGHLQTYILILFPTCPSFVSHAETFWIWNK